MRPFSISEHGKRFVDAYPAPETVKNAGLSLLYEERLGFLRLWVSEGIPFAFRNCPLVYEALREWLGKRLRIHPKLITVIGSARIGYSLKPLPTYGRAFSPESDLDLAVITEDIFHALSEEFGRWQADFFAGEVRPRNPQEETYWKLNAVELPRKIERGFVDPHMIPSFYRYSTAQRINDTPWQMRAKLERTAEAPKVSKVSIRVYRDSYALLNLMDVNFHATLRSLVAKPTHKTSS